MRKLFVVLSLVIVASMALAACGTPATTVATEAPATTGSKDKTTFVVAESEVGIDTLDPALAYDTASGEIIQNVYDSLVFYDGEATDKFVPQLASEMPTISADGTVYTFKIRSGVKFHEGQDLTPTDVAYSFQRGLLQGGYSSPQWLIAEPFFGVGNDDIAMVVGNKISDLLTAKYDEMAAALDLTTFDAAAFGTLFTGYTAYVTQTLGTPIDAAAILADATNVATIDAMVAGLATAADDAAKQAAIKTAVDDLVSATGADPYALADDREALSAVDAAVLKEAGEMVMNAIVADDAAGTVTMTLAQPWGPFLATIAQSWGAIMSKSWVIENGGWDGTAETWQNTYGMASADDPFSTIANGTGPFTLNKFANGEEIILARNDAYWKEPAKLSQVILKQVPEWGTRFSMMQAGDADLATVPPANRSQMDELVGKFQVYNPETNTYDPVQEVCGYDAAALGAAKFTACAAGEKGNGKPFLARLGRPGISMDVILWNWNIATSEDSPNPYIGSGKLDGNGIPPDFFSDVHIRKAFSYSFDFDTFIADVFTGEAVQSIQLTLPGMPGFFLDTPHYSFDLAKAEEEFKLADVDKDGIPAGTDPEGDVWTTGFRVQMSFNQGNTTRQTVAEILAASLSQVNELFVVETLGLPWPAYLRAQRAKQIPLMTGGWLEDIHDPHNWYGPYTIGTYGGRQSLPQDVKDQFKDILNRGVAELDPAKRAEIYKEANQLYYDLAVGLPLDVVTSHGFQQLWVEGVILNPIYPGLYYYTIYKD